MFNLPKCPLYGAVYCCMVLLGADAWIDQHAVQGLEVIQEPVINQMLDASYQRALRFVQERRNTIEQVRCLVPSAGRALEYSSAQFTLHASGCP